MASRWRTWDTDFFIDVHSSKKPEETEIIPAVGQGRGKPPKDVASLNLPRAALGVTKEKKGDGVQPGRGRTSLMKTRALTSSPPVRRPGEKPATKNRLEAFPPLLSTVNKTNSTPDSPKWLRESRSSKVNTLQPKSLSSTSSCSKPPGIPFETLGLLKILVFLPDHPKKKNRLATTGGCDVRIDNLPPVITEKELTKLLQPYGNVLACVIERDGKDQHLGTALVRMESRDACEWIINTFNGEEYPGARGPMVCRFLSE